MILWTELRPAGNTSNNWSVASSSDGSRLIAAAKYGRVYVSSNRGRTWTETRPSGDMNSPWVKVASSATGQYLAVANEIVIYTSIDYGATWTERKSCWPEGNWYSLDSNASGSNLIAGAAYGSSLGGRLYTSSDYGATWTERRPYGSSVVHDWTSAASNASGSVLMAGDKDWGLYISTNYGSSWNRSGPLNGNVSAVDCSGDGSYMVRAEWPGTSGRIYVSSNYGVSWNECRPAGDVDADWSTVSMSDDGSRIIAGQQYSGVFPDLFPGRLFTSSDYGVNWAEKTGFTGPWTASSSDSNGIFLASNGRIYTSELFGIEIDGVSNVNARYDIQAFGGTICGSNTAYNVSSRYSSYVSVEVGGESHNFSSKSVVPLGGSKISGQSDVSITFTQSYNPEGNYIRRVIDDGFSKDGCWTYTGSIYNDFTVVGKKLSVSNYDLHAWLYFDDLSIPQGSVINYAVLRFYSFGDDSDDVGLSIRAEKSLWPSPPTNVPAHLSGVPVTSSSVGYIAEDWIDRSAYSPPNVARIVQELVNVSGWDLGKNVKFLIYSSPYGLTPGKREIYDFSQNIILRAQLEVWYDYPCGVKGSGTADVSKVTSDVADGGIVTSGVSIIVIHIPMDGGIDVSGSSDVSISLSMRGGVGTSGGSDILVHIPMRGGAESSGTAVVSSTVTFHMTMDGGAKSSGTAVISRITVDVTDGGVGIGGNSDSAVHISMDGGLSLSGYADKSTYYDVSTSGGSKISGVISIGAISYVFVPTGGVQSSGISLNDHSYHMSGGSFVSGESSSEIIIVMRGGTKVSGSAVVGYSISVLVGLGSVVLAGTSVSNVFSTFSYTAETFPVGQVIVGGPEDPAVYGIASVKYCGSGEVTTNDILNRAEYSFSFDPSLHFVWRVNAYINKDTTFVWSTGKLGMYWYRIIGKARNGNECDLIADPCCQKFILNVHARTLADLCEKLSVRKFTLPIESVQRFRRPALLGNAFEDSETQKVLYDRYYAEYGNCDELVDVEICRVPECADYCVHFDLRVVAEFEIDVLVDAFFHYEAEGSIYVSGYGATSLDTFVVRFYHTATPSDVILEGDAVCISSIEEMKGGIMVGGIADNATTRWRYVGGEWPSTLDYRLGSTAESVPSMELEGDVIFGDRPWYSDGDNIGLDPIRRDPPDSPWPDEPNPISALDEHVGEMYYTASMLDQNGNSEFLVVRGFNLDVPSNCSVIGIEVQVKKISHQLNIYDTHVVLVDGDDIISNNLASPYSWPYMNHTTSEYGSNGTDGHAAFTPLSSDSWDSATIGSANFGVAVRARNTTAQSAAYAGIDWIKVQVTYESMLGQVIRVTGESPVKSTSFGYSGTGSISLTGNIVLRSSIRYNTYGYGFGTTAIVMRGGYVLHARIESDGGVELSSNTTIVCDSYESRGGMSISGEAEVKPFADEGRGGICLGGRTVPQCRYNLISKAAVRASGESVDAQFFYKSSGGQLLIEGSVSAGCSSWSWRSVENNLELGGSAYFRPGNFELPFILAEADMKLAEVSATFSEDVELNNIEQVSGVVSQCGCTQVPLIISVGHNMIRDNILSKFLARNNYDAIRAFVMRYNVANSSWQANFHYRGLAANANYYERWDLNYELQCSSNMGGIELGRVIWKFSMGVQRKNLVTGEDFDTRIVLGLLPEPICETHAQELDFSVLLDTQTGSALVTPNATAYQITVYDNIGLFKNISWTNNPDLTITVSQKGLESLQRRIDLTDLVYV